MAEIDLIRKVSTYLRSSSNEVTNTDVDVLAWGSGNAKGTIGILSSLAKNSSTLHSSSSNTEYEAQVRQWIEYALLYVRLASDLKMENSVFKELNAVLSTRSYLVGQSMSLADVVMFYSIRPIIFSLNPYEGFVHLARWFDHLQRNSALGQGEQLINFSMVHLLYNN